MAGWLVHLAVTALFLHITTVYAIRRAAIPPGAIKNIVVIDLENKNFNVTFGTGSPATYLNNVLMPQGQLIENNYGTSHFSLGNYLSQISGQASTQAQNGDCIDVPSLLSAVANHTPIVGSFTPILPATPAKFDQIVGDGCVFPSFVKTIADQLDEKYSGPDSPYVYPWRAYAESMGNIPSRDYGNPDPLGGTTCAHPPLNGVDHSNSAAPGDGYATRHNPFMYFQSIIDNQVLCDERVVPLGTIAVGAKNGKDVFSGHLVEDFRKKKTTPAFSFIVPNLCNDGHDGTCAPSSIGGNTTDLDGGTSGGLVASDIWLKHWMPKIMSSPSYRSGEMLIVITFDEAAADATACCNQPAGPNQNGNPGFSPLSVYFGSTPPTAPGQYPGGGKVGAVLLNKRYIKPGVRNVKGEYNHYSALRSYEDILNLTTGGTDGHGHLGYAAVRGLRPFGRDVFNQREEVESRKHK